MSKELIIPDEFYREEERSGYIVTEEMKKIWAIELKLLYKLDSICKKYGLKYYMDYGSLLGAIRHKGFIPWDDDIDVTMFRDDYEKLKTIMNNELEEPYVFQNAYNSIRLWGFAKVRYSGTSAVEHPEADESFHQGIFIDIFPLDDAIDDSPISISTVRMAVELWAILDNPDTARQSIPQMQHRIMDDQMIEMFCQMDRRETFNFMEQYLLSNYGKSTRVNYIIDEILGLNPSRMREDYSQIIELPFEMLTVPVPCGYDNILSITYGDYMQPIQGESCHEGIILDPDKSYIEYLDKQ